MKTDTGRKGKKKKKGEKRVGKGPFPLGRLGCARARQGQQEGDDGATKIITRRKLGRINEGKSAEYDFLEGPPPVRS